MERGGGGDGERRTRKFLEAQGLSCQRVLLLHLSNLHILVVGLANCNSMTLWFSFFWIGRNETEIEMIFLVDGEEKTNGDGESEKETNQLVVVLFAERIFFFFLLLYHIPSLFS